MQQLIHLDEQLAATFYTTIARQPILSKIFVVFGVGSVYLIPIILIITWFNLSRKVALKAALTGLLAWEGLSKLIATLVDRPRPAMTDLGVKELIFHRPDTSFPSDHSSFLMAVALSFYLNGQRKLGHLVLVIAIITGITRVGIGVHFPADILAGWIVGAVVALLIQAISQPLDNYVIEPLIRFARKFRL